MGTLRGLGRWPRLGEVFDTPVIFPTLGLCVGRVSRRSSMRLNRPSKRVRSASIRTCVFSRRPVDQSLRALSHVNVRALSRSSGGSV